MKYNPWGRKELDTSEQVTLSAFQFVLTSVYKPMQAETEPARDCSQTRGLLG